MSKNEYEIIIDPSNTLLQNSTDVKHIIQKDGFHRCLDLIKEKLKLANDYNVDEDFDRYHETITVNGERGTGKTSFILSIENFIKGKSEYINDAYKEDYNKVKNIQPLKLLDPTLLSDRQKILLTIISNISELVEKELQSCPENSKGEWKHKLLSLAEGLNSIINIGSNPNSDSSWDDAGLILEYGLRKARAGVNFEKNFHEFIEKSLDILNKEAFLLILDDIDTNFVKGWDVLETLRKYITTPKIITIISGDLTLYKQLIRNKQLKLFKDPIKYEETKYQEYMQSVDELESQYIIKILKPENYINLNSLNYFVFLENSLNIKVIDHKKMPIDLKVFFEDVLEKGFGIQHTKEKELYLNILSNQVIRTNIQIFKAYNICWENENFNRKHFLEKVKNIFITLFLKYDITMDFINFIRDENRVESFISKFFESKKISMNEFLDNSIDIYKQNKSIVLFVLRSLYSEYMQDKIDNYFEWALKTNLLNKLTNLNNEESPSYEYLKIHNKLSTEERVSRTIGFLLDDIIGISARQKSAKINLLGLSYRHSGKKDGNYKTYTDILKEKGDEGMFFIKLMYSRIQDLESETHDSFSFLYILTFLEQLYVIKNDVNKKKFTEQENFDFISFELNKLGNLKTRFIYPEKFSLQKEENEFDENLEKNITFTNDFINTIVHWISVPISQDDKFNLNNTTITFNSFIERYMSKVDPRKTPSIYEYIKLSSYMFLNELLKQSFSLNFPNIISTFQEISTYKNARERFLTNYNFYMDAIKDKDFQNDLFFDILQCPIWNYYIEDFLTKNNNSDKINKSYTLLKKLKIKNTKVQSTEINLISSFTDNLSTNDKDANYREFIEQYLKVATQLPVTEEKLYNNVYSYIRRNNNKYPSDFLPVKKDALKICKEYLSKLKNK